MKNQAKWITFLTVFALTSCVSLTVNVYFPTKEIKQAAEEIEDRVRSGQGTEGLKSSFYQSPPRKNYLRFALSVGGNAAYAADFEDLDIDINTPVVKKIIETRTKRYKEIEPYMDKGILGEGMNGFLKIRDPKGLDLKALTQLKKLVKEENTDRENLYKEILLANQLEPTKENMKRVSKVFAQAIRKKMEAGHWYEVKKDEWVQKKKEDDEK